ncbi:MAG: hypothetical protein AAGG56_13730 [Pseudomonadota bacterium]
MNEATRVSGAPPSGARPKSAIRPLLNIDYLVFSSHKTATQSVKKSLNKTGLKCKHCHHPMNIGLDVSELPKLARRYKKRNGRKLPIITIFREPISRHISSFFQTHGWKPLSGKSRVSKEETIIYRLPVEDLIERFLSDVSNRTLRGRLEALDLISKGFDVPFEQMRFDPKAKRGFSEHETVSLHILRFDHLIGDFTTSLEQIAGRPIHQSNKNVTDDKWYNDKYASFKREIRIPEALIHRVYTERRHIIELMYEEPFDRVMESSIQKYG